MATPVHGINATLKLGSTKIEGTLDNATMDLQRELAEARHMGDQSVIRLPGLRSATFTAEGDFDATIDTALYNAWNGETPSSVTFLPDGTTPPTYTVDCFIASYSVRAASNAMVRITVNLSSTGDITRS